MGTTLTGTTPQDTYEALIKVGDNGIITGSLKTLSDGEGHDTSLALSTGAASVTGTLAVSSDVSIADKIIHTGDTNTAIRFPAADTITLETDAVERMRITSTGNVGLGTNAPTAKLDIQGTLNVGLFNTNTPTTLQNDNTAATPTLSLFKNTTLTTEEVFRVTSFQGAVTTVASINSGGIVAANGLKFPATQVSSADANTLDDYEEGTWTMGISFGGASVAVTTVVNTGSYTKIGRQVTATGYMLLSNKGSSTGSVKVTGLPFTIKNADANTSTAGIRLLAVTFANQFQGWGQINSTTINLEEITEAGVVSSLTDADFANNSQVIVSFTYFV